MRECGETDAALSPSCKQVPVEREPGRGRLERDRVGGKSRPDIPQGQRLGDMRVLDRPPMSSKAGEDSLAIPDETQGKEAGMGAEMLDHSNKRPE